MRLSVVRSLAISLAAPAAAFLPTRLSPSFAAPSFSSRLSAAPCRTPHTRVWRANFGSSSTPQSETKEIAGVKFQVDARPAPGQPFHFAFPVHDLDAARSFWGGVMGCTEGRCAPGKWIDFSLYGHQIVCHWVGKEYRAAEYFNPVDGDEVPVPHFGIVLDRDKFHELAERVEAAGIKFVVPPQQRFKDKPGDQWTMFFKDPSNNALEFKTMVNPDFLFARYDVDSH